jgi:hypothetical protein
MVATGGNVSSEWFHSDIQSQLQKAHWQSTRLWPFCLLDDN